MTNATENIIYSLCTKDTYRRQGKYICQIITFTAPR